MSIVTEARIGHSARNVPVIDYLKSLAIHLYDVHAQMIAPANLAYRMQRPIAIPLKGESHKMHNITAKFRTLLKSRDSYKSEAIGLKSMYISIKGRLLQFLNPKRTTAWMPIIDNIMLWAIL